jgi:hypothetical protein
MRVLFLLAGVGLLVGSFAAFGSRTHVLSAAECQAVTGSVNNKTCNPAASCDFYNNQHYGMVVCPNLGTGFCQHCDVTGNQWQTCQVSTGSNCVEHGELNYCGKIYNGLCNSNNVCDQLVWYGYYCHNAPQCGP